MQAEAIMNKQMSKSKFLIIGRGSRVHLEFADWNPNKNETDLCFRLPTDADRSWFWAFPQIEGVPPCARGGHTATLIGASILYFGGHYYAGQKQGYVYLNDTHVLDLNSSRWIKPKV